jgi:hypothetical protein
MQVIFSDRNILPNDDFKVNQIHYNPAISTFLSAVDLSFKTQNEL